MKDRKTLLILWIPFLFYLFGVGAYLLSEQIEKAPPPPERQIRGEAAVYRPEDHPVDLNCATMEELLLLPEIGETKARRILDYREAHGGFRSVEELLEIQGIGETQLELLKDYVCVED